MKGPRKNLRQIQEHMKKIIVVINQLPSDTQISYRALMQNLSLDVGSNNQILNVLHVARVHGEVERLGGARRARWIKNKDFSKQTLEKAAILHFFTTKKIDPYEAILYAPQDAQELINGYEWITENLRDVYAAVESPNRSELVERVKRIIARDQQGEAEPKEEENHQEEEKPIQKEKNENSVLKEILAQLKCINQALNVIAGEINSHTHVEQLILEEYTKPR